MRRKEGNLIYNTLRVYCTLEKAASFRHRDWTVSLVAAPRRGACRLPNMAVGKNKRISKGKKGGKKKV